MSTMPRQKPHQSEQVVGTPPEFLASVVKRFGLLNVDLAANIDNRVTERFLGPGSVLGQDSLSFDWAKLRIDGDWMWLNPPFSDIAPWAEKCAAESARGAKILMLTPASIGSNWFRDHVHRKAYVLAIPRLTFVGHASAYPKDLILSVYADGLTGFDTWDWRCA